MDQGKVLAFDLERASIASMMEIIRRELPGLDLVQRHHFRMLSDYVGWLKLGRKRTTIRLRQGAIDCPSQRRLELIAVDDLRSEAGIRVGELLITGVIIKPFATLTDTDA